MVFEIFSSGQHTSDKGITKDYSADDLNFIASNYNPSESEAPIVIGHPVDSSPAYGWIESLKVVGDKLLAKAKDIVPEFLNAVKQGLYKKRSISLDKDGKLRHVGFLGGALPAVKGLADIQFTESDSASTYELDLDPGFSSSVSPLASNEPCHAEPCLPRLGGVEASSLSDISKSLETIQTTLTQFTQNYSQTNDSKLLSNIQSEIDAINSKLKHSEFNTLLDSKLASGSLTPAMKNKFLSVVNFLDSQNFAESASFDANVDKVKLLLTDFLNSIPKIIYYENFAEKPDHTVTSFSEDYSGLSLDEESAALHQKALSLMQKDNLSYEAAVINLSKRQ
jgi:hypothetical protein